MSDSKSTGAMSTAELEFLADDRLAGYRLHRFEVLNWGTFHQHIWTLEPAGQNGLLTGDIGSGKSTLVDALTTLLVPKPTNQIVFNKAAGAQSQERSLASYVRGEFKSERTDDTLSARAVNLRAYSSYSVLLAYFFNEGYQLGVTLAQVLWFREEGGRPERLFVVAECELGIQQHFSSFGSEIRQLRKRLRSLDAVQVIDTLGDYATQFRRKLGIPGDKALDLFYQTVSLKSVGNLTQFVRDHMLEPGQRRAEVEKLCSSFEDLNEAHEAVLRAKHQIELLTPLIEDGLRHAGLSEKVADYRAGRDMLSTWNAHHQVRLLEDKLARLDGEKSTLDHRLSRFTRELALLKQRETSLRQSFDDAGGGRLNQIEHELEQSRRDLEKRQAVHGTYAGLCKTLKLPVPTSESQFLHNQDQAREHQAELESLRAEQENLAMELNFQLRQLQSREAELQNEIDGLKTGRGNIPVRSMQLRELLCAALQLSEDDLPFIGELIQVREEEAGQWEGASERLLHNFALSMAVEDQYYRALSNYVDRHHLGGRLVYYRVTAIMPRKAISSLHEMSLARKLSIKPDCFCYEWLEHQLRERFDTICCTDLEEFRRHRRAMMPSGQIKGSNERHEKDDRHHINDRSRYVLGWSSEAKLNTLENQLATLQREGQTLVDNLAGHTGRINKLNEDRDHCARLLHFTDYAEIDWSLIATGIDSLVREQQALRASSDKLNTLQKELEKAVLVIADKEKKRQQLDRRLGELNFDVRQSLDQAAECRTLLDTFESEALVQWLARIDEWHRALDLVSLSLRNVSDQERQLRLSLQEQINTEDKRLRTIENRVIRLMSDYRHSYPVETREVDASMDSLSDYQRMLSELIEDGLPGFEQRFQQELQEKTIQSLAHFQTRLTRACDEIKQRITEINQTLKHIEYNEGRYISLLVEDKLDSDIRQFKQDLRHCLADSLAEDVYGEERFLEVKALIERLKGREGLVEADRRWTNKVTDVRNWFEFSASERWVSDGSEFEFYSGSSGKSGGQKEKLAYTVLASALAYQFGLEWDAVRSRSFRFVVIDEAFGRGSDDSARYALELFQKLNLQLLIVTPLQKIHVIEAYINHVHFVHNEGGNNSMLRNMTIEQYRQEKVSHQTRQLQQLVENQDEAEA